MSTVEGKVGEVWERGETWRESRGKKLAGIRQMRWWETEKNNKNKKHLYIRK